jgi:hypothetical protein
MYVNPLTVRAVLPHATVAMIVFAEGHFIVVLGSAASVAEQRGYGLKELTG